MTNTIADPKKSASSQDLKATEDSISASNKRDVIGENMNMSKSQSTTPKERNMSMSTDQPSAQTESNTNISEQFRKLRELFLLQDTGKTFVKSLKLLFIVIKESVILIWLALCWCVVAISLIGSKVTQASEKISGWWHSLSTQEKSKKEVAATTLKEAMQSLISKARKQVGLQVD